MAEWVVSGVEKERAWVRMRALGMGGGEGKRKDEPREFGGGTAAQVDLVYLGALFNLLSPPLLIRTHRFCLSFACLDSPTRLYGGMRYRN